MTNDGDGDDPFGVFGSDDEENNDDDCLDMELEENPESSFRMGEVSMQTLAALIGTELLQQNSRVPLSKRHVALTSVATTRSADDSQTDRRSDREIINRALFRSLKNMGIEPLELRLSASLSEANPFPKDKSIDFEVPYVYHERAECAFDAVILLTSEGKRKNDDDVQHNGTTGISRSLKEIWTTLTPGGILVCHCEIMERLEKPLDQCLWMSINADHPPLSLPGNHFQCFVKCPCPIQPLLCPWLPSHYSVSDELKRAAVITVPLSVWEQQGQPSESSAFPEPASSSDAQLEHRQRLSMLTPSSLQRAVSALRTYGVCVIPRMLPSKTCADWGTALLDDFHHAASILQQRDGVNLLCPACNSPTLLLNSYGESKTTQSADLERTATTSKSSVSQDKKTTGYDETTRDPTSYRELSMREDLRLDLRDGPRLRSLRSASERSYNGNERWNVTAEYHELVRSGRLKRQRQDVSFNNNAQDSNAQGDPTDKISFSYFFRDHPDLLDIVFCAMNNPIQKNLARGNVGRYNFSQGRPGTFQNIRVGPIGGLISLPGAADQALHADTPHLFEMTFVPAKTSEWGHRPNVCDNNFGSTSLPPHYINAFTPGRQSDRRVGQTAFLIQTHELHVSAKYEPSDDSVENDNDNPSPNDNDATKLRSLLWMKHLIRPQLEPGDVLLFDCRILHFGMANMSNATKAACVGQSISSSTFGSSQHDNEHCTGSYVVGKERPILYTNMTMHWFHDPKNWDDQQSIFSD